MLLTADDSGAETAIAVITDDDDSSDGDSVGLSQLAYNVDAGVFTGNLSESRSSSDASFTLNGLALTSTSNTIVGLVDGLNFTLKKLRLALIRYVFQRPRGNRKAEVQGFIDAYNSYQETLSTLMNYEDAQGALAGDSTARRIRGALRSTATMGIVSLSGNDFTSLSDIGVESDRYGKLTLR